MAPSSWCFARRFPRGQLGADGLPLPSGEFWVFKGSSLTEKIEDEAEDIPLVGHDSFGSLAAGRLRSMARDQAWEKRSHTVALAVLGLETGLLDGLRAQGVRVPPGHEQFGEADGWNVGRKDHRSRFRSHLSRCTPRLLLMQPQGAHEGEVLQRLSWSFCLQAADHQRERGDAFAIVAPSDHPLWNSVETQSYLGKKGISLVFFPDASADSEGWKVMSNHRNFANISEPPREGCRSGTPVSTSQDLPVLSESEGMAKGLLARRDFTDRSCQRLLEVALQLGGQSSRAISRNESRSRNLILGAFVHGGVLGVTNEGKDRPHLTRYLCEFLRSKGD